MPRLGHKKSRLGCRQCKSRHVKCDELKPCSSCARHGVQCSLITDPPPSAPAAGGSRGAASKRERESKAPKEGVKTDISTSSPSLLIDYVLNPSAVSPSDAPSDGSSPNSQPDQFPFLRPFIHESATNQSDLWVRDLELMHHWTIEAYDDLSQREDMRHTWRVEAPKVAVTYTFLMHEILALAAFHKASQVPDRRQEYYTLGIHHQDLAIKGLRPKLQNIVPAEAPAMMATSTLLTLGVFASTGFEATCPDSASPSSAINGLLNIFSLMQGIGNVLALAHAYVLESFLAPMFRDPVESTPPQPLFQEFIQHIPTLMSFVETKEDLGIQERADFLRVIASFEPVLKLASPPRVDNRELRFLFFWPLHLDGNFITRVRQRHPGSLVILMYYSTLLFAAEPRYWFMKGWGHRIMRACYDSIDRSWLPAVQWPVSFLDTDPAQLPSSTMSRSSATPGLSWGPSVSPYAQQSPQAVPFRQQSQPLHTAKPKTAATLDTLSTLNIIGPYPHQTGRMPPPYAPQTTSPLHLSRMPDAVQEQHVEHAASSSTEHEQDQGTGAINPMS